MSVYIYVTMNCVTMFLFSFEYRGYNGTVEYISSVDKRNRNAGLTVDEIGVYNLK